MDDKTLEELAKLGQRSLGTLEKLGGWLDDVFGQGLREAGTAFEHSMAGFKLRNLARVLQKTEKALEASGFSGTTRALDPRIGIALLEAIGDEPDETLQDVWAAYILNAINPDKPRADRVLIEVIKKLEPSDWPLLQQLFLLKPAEVTAESLERDFEVLEEALDRLTSLGLFSYDDNPYVFLTSAARNPKFEAPISLRIVSPNGPAYEENKLFRKLADATSTIDATDK